MDNNEQTKTDDLQTDNLQDDANLNNDGQDTPPANDGADGKENKSEDGKENKESDENDIYGSPETFDYSETNLPDGMTLDQEMLGKFEPLAKELNLSNKSANKLMNLAVELVSKNTPKADDLIAQIQEAEANSYKQLLVQDKELPQLTEDYEKYLSVANAGIKAVATKGFKDLLIKKGLVNHPEFIKTFYAIGKLTQDDSLPNVKTPVGIKEDAADILYGKKD